MSRTQTSMSPLTFLLINWDHFSINTTSVSVAAPVNHTSRSRWKLVRDSIHPDSTTSVVFSTPSSKTHSSSWLTCTALENHRSLPWKSVAVSYGLEKREERMLHTRRGQDAQLPLLRKGQRLGVHLYVIHEPGQVTFVRLIRNDDDLQ